MKERIRRREFVVGAVASVVYVACGEGARGTTPEAPKARTDAGADAPSDAPSEAAFRASPTSSPEDSDRVFPQGLASGDPRPDRVILWCRVEPAEVGKAATDDVTVDFVVAKDDALLDVVAHGSVVAQADADHTVRVSPTGLEPGRFYYYRFEVQQKTTRVARTKTAPPENADVAINLAFCACQDRIGRYWHSWQSLLDQGGELDFVLFLGDYIYESVNDARFQSSVPGRDITLPDGLDTSEAQDGSRLAAGTLADYRALYKVYRADPLLKEVHRRFPFVVIWDDHEFADDCWQDHSTSYNELDPVTKAFTSEQNTARRQAANRAFSEYQPVEIVYTRGAPFPDDIKIYRQLRFGAHVDLFLTDQRLYRDDHLIPEGPADAAIGKLTANSSIGSRYFVRKSAFDPRESSAKPTLLGTTQKAWLTDAIKKSTTTWQVWANEVQMWQMALTLSQLPGMPPAFTYTVYVNTDQWDGFRSERAEILSQLTSKNLLVLTGDIHAFFASELRVDFDNPSSKSCGIEFVTAGISSASLKTLVDKTVPPGSTLRPVAEAWAVGADAALKGTNPHLRFAASDAYGYALATIDKSQVEVTFVRLAVPPTDPTFAGSVGKQKFRSLTGTKIIEVL